MYQPVQCVPVLAAMFPRAVCALILVRWTLGSDEIESLRAKVARDVFSPMLQAELPLDASCADVHEAALHTARMLAGAVDSASAAYMEWAQLLFGPDAQHNYEDPPFDLFFGPITKAAKALQDGMHSLSFLVFRHPACLKSSARGIIHKALVPFAECSQQVVATMWWMVDIAHYSNSNSPTKHLQQVYKVLQKARESVAILVDELPEAVADKSFFWGHDEAGMFLNSTVYFRRLFPESALLDKGLLRTLLRLLPVGDALGDFGALDGRYGAWLNDTGLITAFAFDGVRGVSEITEGRVAEVDLSQPFSLWRSFDWVMSIEVAEHISPEREAIYLNNLASHAEKGLIISWAPPHVEGEGHVNCKTLDESRASIEALGFKQDEAATARLRKAAMLSWVAESLALYRKV